MSFSDKNIIEQWENGPNKDTAIDYDISWRLVKGGEDYLSVISKMMDTHILIQRNEVDLVYHTLKLFNTRVLSPIDIRTCLPLTCIGIQKMDKIKSVIVMKFKKLYTETIKRIDTENIK